MKKLLFIFIITPFVLLAQRPANLDEVQPGRFDQGRMWTFENPPKEYFQEAYGFTPTQEWMDDIRKSALRFASWCSASFVSSNGLIMTNHHCARPVAASVMNEDENFEENGFYATTQDEERKVPDLFVDQLVMIADITEEVKGMTGIAEDSALNKIQTDYSEKEGWTGLELETRTFYSGGKYSLYGFKRYNDIRLVLYPELAMGLYGGDPDNFTYPRYNLDFTFFRAYDENGSPLQPSNYFEFNPEGAAENEPVFVIGNPGSTGRYLTMAQLYFQRDGSAPAIISLVNQRKRILLKAAEGTDDIYKKDSISTFAFRLSNTEKNYRGRLDGLNDDYLMTKKAKREEEVRKNVVIEGPDPWDELEDNAKEALEVYPEALFLSTSSLRGKVNQVIHKLYDYKTALEEEDTESAEKLKADILDITKGMDVNLERAMFVALLEDLRKHSRQNYLKDLIGSEDAYDAASRIMEASLVLNEQEKFFKLKAGKLEKESLMPFANVIPSRYREASAKMGALGAENRDLQEKIMNLQFQITGVSSPPDATFSLRMADGVVKGYDYNGTTAPYKTTYFGLYDRHYSNDGEFPWNLPEKWKNPPLDLLKEPINFVSTADIIGGNSGSPVINKNSEVVGLVFDGNIESLPGYFIFDDEFNRTVSVHAGGIVAAVKYIYKAERLLSELNAE